MAPSDQPFRRGDVHRRQQGDGRLRQRGPRTGIGVEGQFRAIAATRRTRSDMKSKAGESAPCMPPARKRRARRAARPQSARVCSPVKTSPPCRFCPPRPVRRPPRHDDCALGSEVSPWSVHGAAILRRRVPPHGRRSGLDGRLSSLFPTAPDPRPPPCLSRSCPPPAPSPPPLPLPSWGRPVLSPGGHTRCGTRGVFDSEAQCCRAPW